MMQLRRINNMMKIIANPSALAAFARAPFFLFFFFTSFLYM